MVVLSMILTSRQIRSTSFWSALARRPGSALVWSHDTRASEWKWNNARSHHWLKRRQAAALQRGTLGPTRELGPLLECAGPAALWSGSPTHEPRSGNGTTTGRITG